MKDLIAGIIVAIIALPLSIALAIASGVTPEQGLHTAIIAGFIISFLGGSRVQIGGPTGAFMIIVLGVIRDHGVQGLIAATFLAGLMMIAFGFLKIGTVVKYLPSSIITGFTSGIALVIFTSQIKDFLGLQLTKVPDEFLSKWHLYIKAIPSLDWQGLILGVLSLMILILWPKFFRKIPAAIVAIVLTSLVAKYLNLDIETIGSRFGSLSSAFPSPKLPMFTMTSLRSLLMPAFTIALLGSIESLLSAVVADGMIGGRHRSNMELVAQGLANMASSVFGGLPATGAIARTVANIRNGGRTPVAGMTHAVVLLIFLKLFMPLMSLIPMATLAAILIMVAYNMSEWRVFVRYFKAPKSDLVVLLVTFFLTVLIDLVIAIQVGIVLAALLFMVRMIGASEMKLMTLDGAEETTQDMTNHKLFPFFKHIMIYEITGPFFFGVAERFLEGGQSIDPSIKVLLIKMDKVPLLDASAMEALSKVLKYCYKHGMKVEIIGAKEDIVASLLKGATGSYLKVEDFFASLEEALAVCELD